MPERPNARLDVELVRRGLVPSRERAQEALRAGLVTVNGTKAVRAATQVSESDVLRVAGDPIGYVGRGGLKLEAALERFGVEPGGMVCLDVGASTGGFTECLLRRGARKVYAVDVGRDQLHPSLRGDPRVQVMEQTDIRRVEALPEVPSLVVIDVSFISLALVLPSVVRLLEPVRVVIALIKPQFEVGREGLGKGGIVRDAKLQELSVQKVLDAARSLGLEPGEVIPSPVLGTEGNREFLVILR